MSTDESKTYAGWLLKVANLIAAGMVVSLSIFPQRVSTTMVVLGMLSTPALYAIAFLLAHRVRDWYD